MRKLASLLLLAAALQAADPIAISFRAKKDPSSPRHGWLLAHDDSGFSFEYFGSRRRIDVRWRDLVPEDAKRLRLQLGLERSEAEKLGLIDGRELLFLGGGSARGVLELVDEDGRHWLRHEGVVLPYPADRIDSVVEISIREREVYTEEELYLRRLERVPPSTARQHRDLAEYMDDVGNWERAEEHYREALRLEPEWAPVLRPRLAAIEEIRAHKEAQARFRKAKTRANLHGDYQGAIRSVRDYIQQHPEVRRAGLQVFEAIRNKRLAKLRSLYHRAKAEGYDRAIRRYLVRRQPTLEEAMWWVIGSASGKVFQRVERRLALGEGELSMLRDTEPTGAPHWATYKDGTFVVSVRAVRGGSARRTVRGDPEAWWRRFHDINTRSTFLKAYGAERLPELFEVVSIRSTPCIRCGGTGRIRVMMFMRANEGPTEWKQTCPRCFGARDDRGVGYR